MVSDIRQATERMIDMFRGYREPFTEAVLRVHVKEIIPYSLEAIDLAFERVRRERPDRMPTAYQLALWCRAAQRDLEMRAHFSGRIPEQDSNPAQDTASADSEQAKRYVLAMRRELAAAWRVK